MQIKLPLEGIRVVDFSWIFMGPLVTKFFGDFGAQVIKVESPTRPDDVRAIGPFKENKAGPNRSTTFAIYNTSKLSVTLNLTFPEARDLVKKIVSISDIVVETFAPGTLEKLGLGYDKLSEVRPDIIMLRMTMSGQDGPFSKQPMVGTQFQAGAGITHFVGWPDRPPLGVPNPYTDYIAPWFAMCAVLSALDYRDKTGRGQCFDISQAETTPYFLAPAIMDYIVNKRVQTRMGNRSDSAVPHGAFRCKGNERWCAVAIFNDEEWQGFCKALDNPVWAENNRFGTFLSRKRFEDELERLIEASTVQYEVEELVNRLTDNKVPAAVVQNGRDLIEIDRQLRHRGHFVNLRHSEIGDYLAERPPFGLSETPAVMRAAPCLGEHNEYVCTKLLGMTDEEFIKLSAVGAFG